MWIAPPDVLIDCTRICAAIELSKKAWLVAIYRPSLDRTSQHRVKPGDAAHLLMLLERARGQEERALGQTIEISCCYEAGYDGIWLHRQLEAAGVENFVIDPTSLLVNRRARRAKTDRIDVRGLLRSLSPGCVAPRMSAAWSIRRAPSKKMLAAPIASASA
jgi:transposase